jgi:phospholipid/cholesterol/gamma-HCH transport system substrate-binding protein
MRAGRMAWLGRITLLAVLLVCVSGCRFQGLTNMALPFSAGRGDGGYTVTVSMANIGNLVPNSEVKVADVTVGTVIKVALQNWQAVLTVAVKPEVHLPVGTTAKIGQKSLLGAEYLQLTAPPGRASGALLVQGSHIPLSQTGRYPETEEVLAATSLLLNGGGLGQIQTITTELNSAMSGRTPQVRDAVDQLGTLFGSLEQQRTHIEQAIDSVDRLSGNLAKGNHTIDTAVQTLAPGIEVFADQRPDFTKTLTAAARFSDVANDLVRSGRQGIEDDLANLEPVLRTLADSGDSLPQSLDFLTAPVPRTVLFNVIRGDAFNASLVLDVTLPKVLHDWFPGTPLGSLLGSLEKGQRNGDPLQLPLLGAHDLNLGQTQSPTGPLPPTPLLGGDHTAQNPEQGPKYSKNPGDRRPVQQPDQPPAGGLLPPGLLGGGN